VYLRASAVEIACFLDLERRFAIQYDEGGPAPGRPTEHPEFGSIPQSMSKRPIGDVRVSDPVPWLDSERLEQAMHSILSKRFGGGTNDYAHDAIPETDPCELARDESVGHFVHERNADFLVA
jgi:hypothetical protein